jgi:DNA-binding XRE family transcriptional regulator
MHFAISSRKSLTLRISSQYLHPMDGRRTEREVWTSLRVLREKDGHSLTSLARAADMSLGYLCDLENGRREPNPRITLRLAHALNVPTSVLEKHRRDVTA